MHFTYTIYSLFLSFFFFNLHTIILRSITVNTTYPICNWPTDKHTHTHTHISSNIHVLHVYLQYNLILCMRDFYLIHNLELNHMNKSNKLINSLLSYWLIFGLCEWYRWMNTEYNCLNIGCWWSVCKFFYVMLNLYNVMCNQMR